MLMVPIDDITIVSKKTGGRVNKNENLMALVPNGDTCNRLIKAARYGTPMIKIGEKFPRIMIIAGIHGNELAPQIAALWIAEELIEKELNGTVYITPFAIPDATMKNSRRFKGFDMNRSASKEGSPSNKILNAIATFDAVSVADFHATKPRSNPGIESVFCSKIPCPESYMIAKYITNSTQSKVICHKNAGSLYSGAIEDECNLKRTAAVTCEVVSENCEVAPGSPERSYLQMISYLKYFGIV
jgi:predicted deacylase